MTFKKLGNEPRIAMVTGAAAGIGLATAQLFRDRGDIAVLVDIDAQSLAVAADAFGAPHLAIVADVTDEQSIRACFDKIAQTFGRLDVLVNNAGIVDPRGTPAIEKSLEEVEKILAVNLEGCLRCADSASKLMAKSGGGAIVNLASLSALVTIPGRAAYAMSKAAVLGLTEDLARAWKTRDIRVNAVLPGYVETEIVRSLVANGRVDPERAAQRIPLGRMADPFEIAEAIYWIAGASSSYGQRLIVDGGYGAFGGSDPIGTPGATSLPRSSQPTALIVGASSEIKQALSAAYELEGIRTAYLSTAADQPATFGMPGDDWTADSIGQAVADIMESLGGVDILVNVIGEDGVEAAAVGSASLTVDTRSTIIRPFAVAQSFARSARGGAIVYLLAGGTSMTREAITGLTKSLACEWAGLSIRVNAVQIEQGNDIERLQDVASAISFLSSERSSYMTGTVLRIG